MFMQEKRFWHLIKHKLFYANLIIYGVMIILVLTFHQDMAWSQKTLWAYMWSGAFTSTADVQLCNEAVRGIKAGEDAERIRHILEQAAEIDPYGRAQTLLGAWYMKQGDDDKALACYNRYRSINPSAIDSYISIINILQKKQDYEAINQLLTDGIKHFSRRVKLYRPHPDPNVSQKEFNIKAVMIYEKSQEGLKLLKEMQKRLEVFKR
jgi:tetratricopeptide (TPR) repeat protein